MRIARNSLACAVVVGAICAIGTAPEGLHGTCTAFAQAPTAKGPTADFFVSPKGNDRWSGRLADPGANDGPFATLERARDAIRALRRKQGSRISVRVTIRGGTYYLDRPVEFGPKDSGAERTPVVYAAAAGEKVVLSGGRRLTGGRWGEVSGRRAWVVDVPEAKHGTWRFRQLFVNGERRPRTRWPKEGCYRIAELPGYNYRDGGSFLQGTKEFIYAGDDIRPWHNLRDVEVVAVTRWIDNRLPIASVDVGRRLVTFDRLSLFSLEERTKRCPSTYWVENVSETLDAPGQWYLDRSEGRLYCLPKPGEEMPSAEIIAPRLSRVLRLAGEEGAPVAHIRFEGLTVSHTEWEPPADWSSSLQAGTDIPGAVYLNHARNCAFTDGAIEHVGTYGLEVDRGCVDIEISRNRMTDLGAGGIKVGHFLSYEPSERGRRREAEMPKGPHSQRVTISDNEIAHGGLFFAGAVGIFIGDNPGNQIVHNSMHDFHYSGISVGSVQSYGPNEATGNVIEHNHVYNIGSGLLNDLGGIYLNSVAPGTRVRYNVVHDIHGHPSDGQGNALGNDEAVSDVLFEKNLVYRCESAWVLHFGHRNQVVNNIFALSTRSALGLGYWDGPPASFILQRNIICFAQGEVAWPHVKPGDFAADHNVYWDASGSPITFGGKSFAEWQAAGIDRGSIVADPLFVDPKKGDFRLRQGSPAAQIGFEPWDLSAVGPRPRPAASKHD